MEREEAIKKYGLKKVEKIDARAHSNGAVIYNYDVYQHRYNNTMVMEFITSVLTHGVVSGLSFLLGLSWTVKALLAAGVL